MNRPMTISEKTRAGYVDRIIRPWLEEHPAISRPPYWHRNRIVRCLDTLPRGPMYTLIDPDPGTEPCFLPLHEFIISTVVGQLCNMSGTYTQFLRHPGVETALRNMTQAVGVTPAEIPARLTIRMTPSNNFPEGMVAVSVPDEDVDGRWAELDGDMRLRGFVQAHDGTWLLTL